MDLKAYWKEIAGKAGLSTEEVSQMEAMLGNEKVAKAFEQGFKPLPDYSRDLDSVRDRTRKELEDKHKTDLAKWEEYAAKQEPKYQEYLKGLTKLQQYQTLYGELEGGDRYRQDRVQGDVLTKAEVQAMLKEQADQLAAQQRQREAGYLDYFDISRDYERTFKKPFQQEAFQQFMETRPDLKGAGMKLAYKEFIGPDAEKTREAEWQAKMDARYQEGIRDGASRKVTPTGHAPKTFSPLLDQKTDVKKMSEFEQERHSRESFLAALNNPDEPETKPA
jgi:hypothetical protein